MCNVIELAGGDEILVQDFSTDLVIFVSGECLKFSLENRERETEEEIIKDLIGELSQLGIILTIQDEYILLNELHEYIAPIAKGDDDEIQES